MEKKAGVKKPDYLLFLSFLIPSMDLRINDEIIAGASRKKL